MFYVNHNQPGCLPEAEGADLPTWRDAVEYAAREIREMADLEIEAFGGVLEALSDPEGFELLQAEGAAVAALRSVREPQPVTVYFSDRAIFIQPAE